MADVLVSLVQYFSGLGSLSAIVGQRVYTGILPQAVLLKLAAGQGAISLSTVFDADQVTHSGRSGLGRARIQVTCWGASFTDANTIARAVKLATGRKFDDALGFIMYMGRRDMHEPGQDVYPIAVDIAVWNSD
jgi:hypothetical protein